jgi:hypothetical protein
MNKKLSNIFWGILLITGGVYAFARTMGVEVPQDPTVWTFIFGGVGVVSLILYFAGGVKNWEVLFPAGIFGGLACITALVASGADNPAMAAPLFIGIGLPFIVAFIIDRRRNWWALIPAGVMAFLILVLFTVDQVAGEWIGAGFLFILAVIFFLVYWSRRGRWPAIVAYVLGILGFMPLMAMTSRPELSGAIMLFGIGLPFLYMYYKSPARWWAIVPAGILLTLGIVTAVVLLPGNYNEAYDNRIANAMAYTGIAATFAVVWLRHHKRWAMVLAALAVILAVASAFFGNLQQSWPVILILAGIVLIFSATRARKS